MTEPIPFTAIRYRCPHCPRTRSKQVRIREHIPICWYNPEARGCKTCKNFFPADEDRCDAPNGCGACNTAPEGCAVGVSLDGHGDEFDLDYVRPGPIIGCPRWEAVSTLEGAA